MPVTTLALPEVAPVLTVVEAAEQRHSIRQFKPEALPEADLREVLRLVSLAPSAFNAQPLRFVVVRDAELKGQLFEAAHRQRQVASAPAVIVLYTDMADTLSTLDEVFHPGMSDEAKAGSKARIQASFQDQSEADRESWGVAQGNIALGYLMLVAQALGYATSPMLGFDADKVKQILGLPAHVRIPAIVPIGVADEAGFSTHRHDLHRIATFR